MQIAIDEFRGGTGAAPTRIRDHRDHVGIPMELAIESVDKRLRDDGNRDHVSIDMKCVIIGNSAAGIGAVEGIRQIDRQGKITVITDDWT